MRKFHTDLDDYTMDIVTKALCSMRVIEVEFISGHDAVYRAAKKQKL